MPFVHDTIIFVWQLQKGGVNTAPGSAPSVTLIPPGGIASTVSPVAIDATNAPGAYKYNIANAIAGVYFAWLHTTDVTFDKPDILSSITVDSLTVSDPLLNVVPGSYAVGTAGYDIGTTYQRISSGNPTFQNPVDVAQTQVRVQVGNTYYASESRQLTFTAPSNVNLTGSTVTFNATTSNSGIQPVTGTVLNSTQCQFEFGTDATGQPIVNGWIDGMFSVNAVLTNGHQITIAWGIQLVEALKH